MTLQPKGQNRTDSDSKTRADVKTQHRRPPQTVWEDVWVASHGLASLQGC